MRRAADSVTRGERRTRDPGGRNGGPAIKKPGWRSPERLAPGKNSLLHQDHVEMGKYLVDKPLPAFAGCPIIPSLQWGAFIEHPERAPGAPGEDRGKGFEDRRCILDASIPAYRALHTWEIGPDPILTFLNTAAMAGARTGGI